MLEEKQQKNIWMCDMVCPQENNTEKKRPENRANYKQLAFEIRERRPGFKILSCAASNKCLWWRY